MKKLLYSVFLLVLTASATSLAHGSATSEAKTPLAFTENKGQYLDTDGNARPDLLFKASRNGVDIYFQKNRVSYVFRELEIGGESVKTLRADLVFEGANANVVVKSEDALPAHKNFAVSGETFSGVKIYEKLTYENIYDNIDLVFYTVGKSEGSFIKYDFIVKPGGDPSAIAARYEGAKALSLTPEGGLLVETALGRLTEDAPVCYQETRNGKRKSVAGKFALEGNKLSYKISGGFSSKNTLIIDPLTRQFASNYGGSILDRATDVAWDANGNALVTGFTASVDFPTVAGQINTFNMQNDAFVLKLDNTGQVVWATYFGGSLLDQGFGITYSPTHKIFITGYTTSSDLRPAGTPALDATYGGGGDGFVLNLDDNGAFRWFTYIGGASNDKMSAVEVTGNSLAVGGSTFSAGQSTTGVAQATPGGLSDVWAGVYSLNTTPANNSLNWATYLGGGGIDQAESIAWSGAELVVAGSTTSSDYPVSGAFQNTNAGSRDVAVTKLNNTGNIIWSTYYGGSSSDRPHEVIADGANNVYIAGQTGSSNFPLLNEFQTDQAGNDGFVFALNANGGQLMSSYLGGDGIDQAFGLAEVNGSLYITGSTNNASNFPLIDPNAVNLPFQSTIGGSFDLYLAKVSTSTNQIQWSTLYGGSQDEVGLSLAMQSNGTMAISGYTNGADFPTLNPISGQPAANTGNDDAVIIYLQDPFGDVCDFTIQLDSESTTDPSCRGDQNGQIVVASPIGNQYRYGLVGGSVNQAPQPSAVFTGLAGATYTLTVVDNINNCEETTEVVLNDPSEINFISAEGSQIECGESNGTITASASGGTGVLSFQHIGPGGPSDFVEGTFNNGAYEVVFSNLTSGSYNLVVRDENQCTSINTVEVLPAKLVSLRVQTGPATCGDNNGTLIYTQLSDNLVGNLDFTIVNLATNVAQTQIDLATFNDLAPGFYSATVTDAENCSATIDEIEVPSKAFSLSVNAPDVSVVCSDGTGAIVINTSGTFAGPLTYQLDGGAPQASNRFENLAPGTYTITVTDADGCTPDNQTTVTVSAPAPISVNVDAQEDDCAATTPASFTISATGGNGSFAYSVDGGATFGSQTFFDNLTAGTYSIVARDAQQCTSSVQQLDVAQNPSALQLVSVNTTNPACTGDANGEITVDIINGTSPYIYELRSGQTVVTETSSNFAYTFEGLSAGNYTVTVTDENNCAADQNVTLSNPDFLVISGVNATPPSACGLSDGSITVNAEGGTGTLWYSFDGGETFTTSNTRTNLFSGFYNIVVRDNDNIAPFCEATDALAINDPGAPSILNVQTIDPLCSNDPTLNNTGQIVINTASNRTPVFFSLNSITGPFEQSNAGGTSHTFSELSAGAYDGIVASVQDITGADCRAFWRTETLAAPEPIIAEDVSIIQPNCGANPTAGGINIVATGGTGALAFSANGGATFTNQSPITGLYPDPNGFDLRIRDSRGCTANAGRYFLFNESGLRLSTPVINSPSCGGMDGSVTITPLGGDPPYTYTIDGGTNTQTTNSPVTFDNLGSGTYIIEVSDQAGCIAQARIELTNLRVINKTVTRPTSCGASDGSVSYEVDGGSGDYSYSYTARVFDPTNPTTVPTSIAAPVTGIFTTDYSVTGLAPGVYFFEVSDNLNNASCSLRDTVIIDNLTGPNVLSVVSQDRNCNLINGEGSPGRGAISIFGTGATTLTYMIDGPIAAVQTGSAGDYTTFDANTPTIGGNLPAGAYQTYVIDAGTNCISTGGQVGIAEPPAIDINDVVVTQPECGQGPAFGEIEVQAVGGNQLEYSFDGGTTWSTSSTRGNIVPGATVYNVIAREAGIANNCQLAWPFPIIISNVSGLTLLTTPPDRPCVGAADSEIFVNVSSSVTAQPPYTYSIDGVAQTTTNVANYTFSWFVCRDIRCISN